MCVFNPRVPATGRHRFRTDATTSSEIQIVDNNQPGAIQMVSRQRLISIQRSIDRFVSLVRQWIGYLLSWYNNSEQRE